ncbi:hypothetical protein GALMADRAFT_227256 [Galerina marginata CBS 339.88]|uniref:F-box domain-containing protein n=1 Tax=Galerina marginata (strain CBS 339.88) TaxID=685588 RepID=A0A067T4R3_GALM3|nr:hypothetical protein GALMADRAFT_227256 [Galerina marginata CBS 339.88]
MPVQTISLVQPATSFGCRDNLGSSTRLNIPRIKTAANAFLRHGYLSPSNQHPNKLNTTCALPEVVLRKIFLACAEFSLHDPSENDRWSWVTLSYVCSSWRRTALEYQDLWRYIDFSHPKWHAITLGRAKMSCLHIISPVTDQNIRLLHRTLQLAHRIQDIHLTSSANKIQPLLEILAHPNPALESLTVDIHIPRNKSSYIDAFDPPSFPTSGPPLKNLKYLELHNTPFYLLTSRCTFLTHFHLHDLPMTERPTLRYFLFMLEQLTHLRFLTLDRAFPINMDLDDVEALERPITLPRLESLSLVGSVPEIANILECIIIPPSAHLIGRICTLSDLKANIWKLTETLSSLSCGGADEFPLDTLVLTGHESCARFTDGFKMNPDFRQSFRIRGFRADCGRGGAAIDLTISPEEHHSTDQGMITTISAIWKALSLTHIHTLAVQDVDIITQKTWFHILRTLPSLRVLDISGRAPSGLVWALLLNARSYGQARDGDGEAPRLLVPRLTDIYLHNVDCSSGGFMVAPSAPVNSHCDLDDSRFLDVLVACLGQRRCFGLCLRSLSIARCEYVLRTAVEEARKAVAYLICDFRLVANDQDVDEAFPARYRLGWDCRRWSPRHYHRLRTLLELDSDF